MPQARDLETFMSTCEELEFPLAGHKQQGPCTRLTHLGSKIDTIAGHLHLTPEKLDHLYKTAALPVEEQVGTHPKKFESLIGTLNHACKVVKPDGSFLRPVYTSKSNAHRFTFKGVNEVRN